MKKPLRERWFFCFIIIKYVIKCKLLYIYLSPLIYIYIYIYMKKIYSFLIFSFFILNFGQDLENFYLASRNGNIHPTNSNNIITALDFDSEQNVISCGVYKDRIGFDMNDTGKFQLIYPNSDGNRSAYLVKHDKNKKYLWHKTISFENGGYAEMTSVAIDQSDNIIIVGIVDGQNVDLDPSNSQSIIYNKEKKDLGFFLLKYSKNGDLLKEQYYSGGAGSPKVTIDHNGNILVVGTYNYNGITTDFDLSDKVYYLAGKNLSSFILKLNKDGDFIWARYVEGHNSPNLNHIQCDNNNDVVISGNNENYFNFNGSTNVSTSVFGVNRGDYIFKLTSEGELLWFQALRGTTFIHYHHQKNFDIDSDNSIAVSTVKQSTKVEFKNKTIVPNNRFGSVIYKLNSNGDYIWHSHIDHDNQGNGGPLSLSISEDHSINWLVNYIGTSSFYSLNNTPERLKLGRFDGKIGGYSTILKLDKNGKLIYNKSKIISSPITKYDRRNSKLYVAGTYDEQSIYYYDTDFEIKDNISGLNYGPSTYLKLKKCYSGTPDGDAYFYTCKSEQKKIKDLYPQTSYSSWYDSPTSITPLSPETILENKKYYAMAQDASCPFNPTRLIVDVRVFENPPKLIVSNFTFCNLNDMRLLDLHINNNQNVEFFDEKLNPIYLGTPLKSNAKYYVRRTSEFIPYNIICSSDLTEFYVYDTSVAPIANSTQSFCEINNPKISDINVTGINLKWYDISGKLLNTNTLLVNNTKYFVTQTSGTCESAKAEILINLNNPPSPNGNNLQVFCSAQNATLQNISVSGLNIKWYDALGNLLPNNTILEDGKTYYATQTIGACESVQRLAVSVTISSNGLSAKDYAKVFCNDMVSSTKKINLHDYEKDLIQNSSNYSFEFYENNILIQTHERNIAIGDTVFDVKIISTLGCFTWVKLLLTLHPKPTITLNPEEEFCNGKDVTLDAGSGFKTYLWSTGETSQKIRVNTEGIYSVTVTNIFDCENSASVKVSQSKLAEIQNIVIKNNTVSIIMSRSDDYLYSIDNINWQSSNEFKNLSNGNYSVYVKTASGCNIGFQQFTIFSVSNVITPNADGVNDTWKISGIENYPNSEVLIMDRFGRTLINKIIDGRFEWNGKLNGRPLPTGTYWYQIKISDGRILQGYLVLKNRN